MLEKTNSALKRIYTTVFSQTFSPCGQYLAVCDNYGLVSVFNAANLVESNQTPLYQFQAFDNGPAHSVITYDKFLIVGGIGLIKAYDWTDLCSKSSKIRWTLTTPNGANYDTPEVNAMAVDDEKLYAGCGDNLIHVWNLDSGALLNSLTGHSDYVHDIALNKERLVSVGEDGNVLVFDTRLSQEAQHILQPWKNDQCLRPGRGKFLKCVDLDTNGWLVCGGGPKMSLWHLQSLSCTTVLDSGCSHNHVQFHDEGMVAGGSTGKLEHWSMDGTLRAEVPCKTRNIFSIGSGGHDEKTLIVAGSGSEIDVFRSVAYPAFMFKLR